MFTQFRKQNWIIISVLFVLLISSIVITYFFSTRIYNDFKSILLSKEDAILNIYDQNLKRNLDDISKDLMMISKLSCINDYVNDSFESESLKNYTILLLEEVLNSNKNYKQIIIRNNNGDGIITLNNKNLDFFPLTSNELDQSDFFQKTLELKKGEINFEITNFKIKKENKITEEIPIIKFSTPLYDLNNNIKGVFTINVNMVDVLKIFPRNFFFQTNEGYMIEFQKTGNITFKKSNYTFNLAEGIQGTSGTNEIHYKKVKYLNKDLFIIGLYHDHSELIRTIHYIIIISIVIALLILLSFIIASTILYKRFKNIFYANRTIVSALAKLSESRDEITGNHLEKVSKYSIILSKNLSKNKNFSKILTREYIKDLEIAVQLHDIGKVGVRDFILLKKGKLDKKEYNDMKEHVSTGIYIIDEIISKIKVKISFFEMGRNIIKYHHEKFDGTGYPFKLSGKEIPLEARIFSLVDAYDAITSKRPYKDAFSHEEAIERILGDKGKHFDPEIVDAFIDCNQEFKNIYKPNQSRLMMT